MSVHAETHPNTPDPVPEYADAAALGAAEPFREDECIPNIPDPSPDFVSEEQVIAPPPMRPAAGEKGAVRGIFRWDIAFLVLVISLFGCMLVSQTISALAMTSSLPVWAQYALLLPLAVFSLGILAFCVSVTAAWFRLRAVRQVDAAALEELRRRAETRQYAEEHFQEARRELRRYLQTYPLTEAGAVRLSGAGVSPELFAELVREREILTAAGADSPLWLDEFRTRFQGRLDAAAHSRVRRWSLAAAGCAMASPIPLLDAILILGIAMKMIKDLCFIYNVRSGRASSLVLLGRAVTAAFVAGVAGDAMNAAADAAGEELTSLFGQSILGSLGAGAARVLAPKLGEGAVNGVFILRLGRAAMRILQPIRPAK